MDQLKLTVPAASGDQRESEQINTALLIDNIGKVEGEWFFSFH